MYQSYNSFGDTVEMNLVFPLDEVFRKDTPFKFQCAKVPLLSVFLTNTPANQEHTGQRTMHPQMVTFRSPPDAWSAI